MGSSNSKQEDDNSKRADILPLEFLPLEIWHLVVSKATDERLGWSHLFLISKKILTICYGALDILKIFESFIGDYESCENTCQGALNPKLRNLLQHPLFRARTIDVYRPLLMKIERNWIAQNVLDVYLNLGPLSFLNCEDCLYIAARHAQNSILKTCIDRMEIEWNTKDVDRQYILETQANVIKIAFTNYRVRALILLEVTFDTISSEVFQQILEEDEKCDDSVLFSNRQPRSQCRTLLTYRINSARPKKIAKK